MVQYAMYVVHWAAWAFFFIARQEQLTESSWLGSYPALLAAWPNRFDAGVPRYGSSVLNWALSRLRLYTQADTSRTHML